MKVDTHATPHMNRSELESSKGTFETSGQFLSRYLHARKDEVGNEWSKSAEKQCMGFDAPHNLNRASSAGGRYIASGYPDVKNSHDINILQSRPLLRYGPDQVVVAQGPTILPINAVSRDQIGTHKTVEEANHRGCQSG